MAIMTPLPQWQAAPAEPALDPVLFHPDYTVGPGFTPDLLTHAPEEDSGERGARGLWDFSHLPPVGNCTPP